MLELADIHAGYDNRDVLHGLSPYAHHPNAVPADAEYALAGRWRESCQHSAPDP